MSEMRHYYLISFGFTDHLRKESGFACVRVGWPENYVDELRIEEARRGACPNRISTPIAVSYLGHMTRESFRGEDG